MYKVKLQLKGLFRTYLFVTLSLCCWASCQQTKEEVDDSIYQCPDPILKFGYNASQNSFDRHEIKPNAFMADILMEQDIDYNQILQLERNADTVFSLRKLVAGKDIIFVREDACYPPKSFIYQPDLLTYVKYDLNGNAAVTKHDIPYEVKTSSASGVIKTNLWNAMMDEGFDYRLIDKMEDAVSQVDFNFTSVGDQFKLVYDEIYVDGAPVMSGNIHSAAFKSDTVIHYGFYFENDRYQGYYDENGVPNKKTFLNAPVKFSRISSVFNRGRFHPVLKRRKAHLGTDYAARTGTEIIAVADGVITKRSFTRGNGNYVKIRHDKTYQTQYLHMSRFRKGQRVGSRVKQGDVIGYVGQTGLATGPHVCFRFWKNGRQVNHRLENFPPLDPMKDEELPEYFKVRDSLWQQLRQVDFKEFKIIPESPAL